MQSFSINGRKIIHHPGSPFIIAEAGINHNGDLELAIEMVDCALKAGCDCIKFQTFHAEDFIADPTMKYTYFSQGKQITESMLDMFARCEFDVSSWQKISRYCIQKGILFLSTPQNRKDLQLLLSLHVPAVKVGSDDFVNLLQLADFRRAGLPLILSCGMADDRDIDNGLKAAGFFEGHPVALLLCTSEYPTPPPDVHLARLFTLRQKYPDLTLGFSDHTQGEVAAVGAAMLGCCIFEKHFTLSHDLPGPDHWFSADPGELQKWSSAIHTALDMYGSAELQPTETEKRDKLIFQRVIVASVDIAEGTVISSDMLEMKRSPHPGGLPSAMIPALIGTKAKKDYRKGDPLCL